MAKIATAKAVYSSEPSKSVKIKSAEKVVFTPDSDAVQNQQANVLKEQLQNRFKSNVSEVIHPTFKGIKEQMKILENKTTIPSVSYDAEYAKELQLKKEADEAKSEWEKWKKSDYPILAKGLDYLGSPEVAKLKSDYKQKEEAYLKQKSIATESKIQKEYGITGDEYIQQLKEKKNNAKSDGEKDFYKKQLKSIRTDLYGKSNVFKHVGNIVKEGAAQVNKGVMASLDFLLGQPLNLLGFENNFFNQANQLSEDLLQTANEETYKSGQYLGDTKNISQAGVVLIAAVPDLLITALTGGGSKTVQIGSKLANPSVIDKVLDIVKETVKSPIFYSSFIQQLGVNYEENLESDDATKTEAALAALLASAVTARMEMGGFQELPNELADTKGFWKKAYKWALSAIEEGLEEPGQTSVTNLINKIVYDKDKKLVSTTDDKAVFNVGRAAKEFAIGTFVGGVLGGTQISINEIVNAKTNNQYKSIGEIVKKSLDVNEIVNYAKSSKNAQIRTIAREVNANTVSDSDIGRIYQSVVSNINEEIDDVYTEKDLEELAIKYSKENLPQSIKSILGSALSNKLIEMNIEPESNDLYNTLTAPSEPEASAENQPLQIEEQAQEITTPEGQGEEITEQIGFREPTDQDIYREPTVEEENEAIFGKRKTVKQRHILDVAKTLDKDLKIVFVPKDSNVLNNKNGKFVFDTNTMYLAEDLTAVEAYSEVFKHEFTHRLELKKAYDSFKTYLFNKSDAFGKYAQTRMAYEDKRQERNTVERTREEAINDLVNMYLDNFKGDRTISQNVRDNFTKEKAEREAVADFVARTLFKGNTADLRFALTEDLKKLVNTETDLELFEEIARDDRSLLQKIIDAIRDFINDIKIIPQFKDLEQDLRYIEQRLTRVYNSAETKKSTKDSGEVYKKSEYFSDNLGAKPITEMEYNELEKHFGTTNNFRVAGYLLTNGKLLDFSGKHWGDTTSRTRQVDHRDVQEVLDGRGNNGVNAMIDMISNGNIRLMPEVGGINLAVYPNEKQRRVLSVYINYMLNTEGEVVIDYDTVGGDTVYSKIYGKTATSRQILNDIRNYFNGARQSELMQFHTAEDVSYSSDDIDIYTEEQYNNFGWVRYNDVLTAAEYNTLLSRYADYKHNKHRYPTTRFGEAVISSFDHLSVIMYVKGTIKNPEITKVVRIVEGDSSDISKINERIMKNEYQQKPLPYETVRAMYGEEYIRLDNRRNNASFRQYRAEQEGRNSQEGNSSIRGKQDRTNSSQPNTANDSAGLNKSAFSMPENESYSSDNLDTVYLKAVKNGDMETAQRLVDEAAKEAGYTIKGYHGSRHVFNKFSKEKLGSNTNTEISKRWFFAADEETANSYYPYGVMKELAKLNPKMYNPESLKNKGKLYSLYLKFENPLIVDVMDYDYASHRESKDAWMEYVQQAEANGNDGIVLLNAMDNQLKTSARESTVYMFKESSQAKLTDPVTYDDNGNIIPLSERFNVNEADIRYSSDDISSLQRDLYNRHKNGELTNEEYIAETDKLWEKANETYGTLPQGEKAKVVANVPAAVSEDEYTKRFTRTIIETDTLKADALKGMEERVLLGDFSYKVASDENAIKVANKAIENGTAESIWEDAVNDGKRISKNQIAIGEQLLADAIKENNTFEILKRSSELSDIFTRAGQIVQAARLLKKMTGAGRLVSLQRTIATLNKDLRQKHGEGYPPIKISEEAAQRLASAKTVNGIEQSYQEILQEVANQVPATFMDKWNAWRYFAMLSNPKTHIRNLIGNGIFVPAVRIKDAIAFGVESAFVKDESKKTKSLIIQKEYRDFAKNDSSREDVRQLLKGNKYNDKTAIREKQKIFKTEVLNFLTEFNSNALEAEDMLCKNKHYIHALAGFLQARGVDLNNVSNDILDEARIYAVKEARKATFNDVSEFANAIQRFANKNLAANLLVEGVLPFKRTPINIVKRGIEYSPIGLMKTLSKGVYDVKKGKIKPTEFIDGLASGLTGTGIMLVGMLLANLGLISGGEKDDDESQFEKLLGKQEYAVEFFGKSYTVDWAAPACIPFFVGVEILNTINEGEAFELSQIGNAAWNSLEPITNLSMLSGIQGVIESARYADSAQTLSAIAVDSLTSYAMQGVPSLSGAISRTIDPTQRSWYIDKNDKWLDSTAQTIKNNIQSKIPGLSYKQIPKIDMWGREVSRGGVGERVLENFISPGYYSEIEYNEAYEELKRIFKETEVDVFPNIAAKYFKVNNETKHLTANEYVTYAKAKGEYSFDYLQDFIQDAAYKKLDDKERADVIENLYEYANAKAKTTVSDYDLMKSYKTVTNWERNGRSAVDYYIYQAIKKQ